MSSKFWTELSSDYEKLFETELGYDVIIYAGEEPNVKEKQLISHIQEYLIEHQTEFLYQNPTGILES